MPLLHESLELNVAENIDVCQSSDSAGSTISTIKAPSFSGISGIFLPSPVWTEGTVVSLCMCAHVCVCVSNPTRESDLRVETV